MLDSTDINKVNNNFSPSHVGNDNNKTLSFFDKHPKSTFLIKVACGSVLMGLGAALAATLFVPITFTALPIFVGVGIGAGALFGVSCIAAAILGNLIARYKNRADEQKALHVIDPASVPTVAAPIVSLPEPTGADDERLLGADAESLEPASVPTVATPIVSLPESTDTDDESSLVFEDTIDDILFQNVGVPTEGLEELTDSDEIEFFDCETDVDPTFIDSDLEASNSESLEEEEDNMSNSSLSESQPPVEEIVESKNEEIEAELSDISTVDSNSVINPKEVYFEKVMEMHKIICNGWVEIDKDSKDLANLWLSVMNPIYTGTILKTKSCNLISDLPAQGNKPACKSYRIEFEEGCTGENSKVKSTLTMPQALTIELTMNGNKKTIIFPEERLSTTVKRVNVFLKAISIENEQVCVTAGRGFYTDQITSLYDAMEMHYHTQWIN